MTKRVMILATDGFEQSELEQPKQRLEEAGFETAVVSPNDGEIKLEMLDLGNIHDTADQDTAEIL